jgi:hypothetical protein
MPKLSDFYDAVSRRADTDGTKINVAETKRVLACAFDELAKLTASEAASVIAKGLEKAECRTHECK